MPYYRYTQITLFALFVSFLNTTVFSQSAIDKNSLGFGSLSTVSARMSIKRTAESGAGAQVAVLLNNLGVRYAMVQDLDNALSSLRQAIAADPKMQEAYINLSIVSEMMKNNTDAVAAAGKAVQLDNKSVRATEQLCDVSLAAKLFTQAVNCYQDLQALRPPDGMTLVKYGVALSQTDDTQRALQVLQKVVITMPEQVAGWNALGTVYFKKKQYREAAETFSKAVGLNPDVGQLRYNLAIAQLANKNKYSAISQYNLLTESSPGLAKRLYRVLYGDKVVFVDDIKK